VHTHPEHDLATLSDNDILHAWDNGESVTCNIGAESGQLFCIEGIDRLNAGDMRKFVLVTDRLNQEVLKAYGEEEPSHDAVVTGYRGFNDFIVETFPKLKSCRVRL
jgi:hypothetical protein